VFKKAVRYYNTIKYLKWSQLFGRFYYVIKRKRTNYNKYYNNNYDQLFLRAIKLKNPVYRYNSFKAPSTFNFINIEHSFNGEIKWNYNQHGKLWTYNLNYFDFINQKEINKEDVLQLIQSYIKKENALKDGKEPYPVSLRIINWLKFLYIHKINDPEINNFILGDLKNLEDNLEYHLLGNHLLENAFALTLGGYCLRQENLYKKGKSLLLEQLSIQICSDGGHYELSPMYHQILLDRLLDAINFIGYYEDDELVSYAEKMLSWLKNISFQNGAIPYVSDSAPGIAPTTKELFEYASRLGIDLKEIPLSDSGYRVYKSFRYECLVDGGDLGPEYHTGHGHNDAGSFLLNIDGKPIITDTSISTYEEGERRLIEKSVISHNTTHPQGVEPSEMWKSFRVGRRESVAIEKEDQKSITIKRVFPFRTNYVARRNFIFSDDEIEIFDQYNINDRFQIYHAYLHFNPGIEINLNDKTINTESLQINIEGAEEVRCEACLIANGYNNLVSSKKIVIKFQEKLYTNIKIK